MTLLAATLCLGPTAAQSQSSPWPEGVRNHGYDLNSSFVQLPLPTGEEAFESLDGKRMSKDVDEIVAFSIKDKADGNLLWGRVAGSKNDAAVTEWVERRFRAIGLENVKRETFDLPPQWFPTSWRLTASAGGQKISFESARASGVPLPEGGLELEPIWVGLGTEADFAGRDVRGKLVVVSSIPQPGTISHSAGWLGVAKRAQEKGAAALLVNIALPGNFEVQVAPGPRSNTGLTTFTMGTRDTDALRSLIEKGPVRIHADYRSEMRENLKDYSIWGSLPGTTDEDVYVLAHHDAVFTGGMDNASGMAVMLALAEHFAKIPKEQRRRTIHFVSTAGHHNGSPATAAMHEGRSEIFAKTALVINSEHVASAQTYIWGVNGAGARVEPALRLSNSVNARMWWIFGSDRLASIALDAWKRFGVTLFDTMEPHAPGDISHIHRDVPNLQLIDAQPVYHTNAPDIVPAPALEAVARSYAKILREVDRLDRADIAPRSESANAKVSWR
jgi:hypothetical protein